MVEVKTIEQLLYFIKTKLSLSRYDERFIDNLMGLKEVTTNQAQLFDRIIHKYRRQLSKYEISLENIADFPWDVKLIDSAPAFTDGYLYIEDNIIKFRCPFNRNFINKFRSVELNNFIWNKSEKYYETPYSVSQLKLLLNTSKQYYPKILFSETVTELLDPLKEYANIKHWTPTLVRANGNLIISASNEYLNEAIKDIELNTSPTTLMRLSMYGIDIDSSVTEVFQNPKLKFSAEYNPIVERRDLKNIIPWLKELGCDLLLVHGNPSMLYEGDVLDLLKQNNIKYIDVQMLRAKSYTEISNQYQCCVSIRTRNNDNNMFGDVISKSIKVVNSEPITIK